MTIHYCNTCKFHYSVNDRAFCKKLHIMTFHQPKNILEMLDGDFGYRRDCDDFKEINKEEELIEALQETTKELQNLVASGKEYEQDSPWLTRAIHLTLRELIHFTNTEKQLAFQAGLKQGRNQTTETDQDNAKQLQRIKQLIKEFEELFTNDQS